MMFDLNAGQAVFGAVDGALEEAVFGAVEGDMYWAVGGALDLAVFGAADQAVSAAVDQRTIMADPKLPEHPAIQDFLRSSGLQAGGPR